MYNFVDSILLGMITHNRCCGEVTVVLHMVFGVHNFVMTVFLWGRYSVEDGMK